MSATYKIKVVSKNRPDDTLVLQFRSRKVQWQAYLELSNDPRVLSVDRVLDGYKLFTNIDQVRDQFQSWAGPKIESDDNQAAYSEGQVYKDRTDLDPEQDAFDCYKQAVAMGRFKPSVSASVCFVAGFLGNEYPSHDERVTS